MCRMTAYQWLVLFVLLLRDALALKDVLLTIQPKIVQKSHEATLRCSYDLEHAKLYYVKWYRGSLEFFRYTPSEDPYSKVFPYEGINVDLKHSNSTQVVLLDIDFQLSGNFTCEVTTAEDPARTDTNTQSMLVIQLPDTPPTISVGRNPLDVGDFLRANCTSVPGRPAAALKFILNNMTVAWTEPLHPLRTRELLWSDLPLVLQLTEYHFNQGRLILRCVAQVMDIYREEAVLELDSAKHPVPEKVSAVDSASPSPARVALQLLLFAAILIIGS